MIPAQLSLKLSLRRHAPHRLLDLRLGDVAVALGPEGFAGEVDLEGYRRDQPWINSSFAPDGSIRPAYVQRAVQIIRETDRLGLVVIAPA